ncbi:hypothetical protein OBBRIDRAFT_452364 [Obba rivulosa]|uniref:Uncharacterized protein n=1 Tax=Obba rivulosa TaxID=1052685 RepID=A0A8E2B1U5_9APHY|nr:hypothetical protein OBBRIDRAFT_452364 [Obba rivulosa]
MLVCRMLRDSNEISRSIHAERTRRPISSPSFSTVCSPFALALSCFPLGFPRLSSSTLLSPLIVSALAVALDGCISQSTTALLAFATE